MSEPNVLTMSATVPPHVFVQELPDGELVLLDLHSERYFGLDGVGAQIWLSVTMAPTVGGALPALQQTYVVDRELLRRDVERIVRELSERDLLRLE